MNEPGTSWHIHTANIQIYPHSLISLSFYLEETLNPRECSGSVVECLPGNGGAASSSLEQDTYFLAKYLFNPGNLSLLNWKIVDWTLRIKSNKQNFEP